MGATLPLSHEDLSMTGALAAGQDGPGSMEQHIVATIWDPDTVGSSRAAGK